MSDKHRNVSLFEQLKEGLEDSIAYSKGELSLNTAELPAPPPAMDAGEIRAIRNKFRMSQALFAATINVSTRTVQSWEQDKRQPSDAALRVIELISHEPKLVKLIFTPVAARSAPTSKRVKRRRRLLVKK